MQAKPSMVVGVVVAMLAIASTNDVWAQSTTRGYLTRTGDYDEWTVSIRAGFFYVVWIRADDKWINFDLYVYDSHGALVCSSTDPGGLELCVFYAWHSEYHIKVVSVGGCPPSAAGLEHRSCGEGWYTLGT